MHFPHSARFVRHQLHSICLKDYHQMEPCPPIGVVLGGAAFSAGFGADGLCRVLAKIDSRCNSDPPSAIEQAALFSIFDCSLDMNIIK